MREEGRYAKYVGYARSLNGIPPFTMHGKANRAYSTACAAYYSLHSSVRIASSQNC